ncbi:MAG TPA: hypothetical protein VLE89_06010 [Chlamydiales bacterium]|nr:hypothetical protein [Chlamydiales bacterium]
MAAIPPPPVVGAEPPLWKQAWTVGSTLVGIPLKATWWGLKQGYRAVTTIVPPVVSGAAAVVEDPTIPMEKGFFPLVGHVAAAATPYIKQAVVKVVDDVVTTAKTAYDNSDQISQVRHPTQIVPLLRRAWGATPLTVQMAGTYLFPLGWLGWIGTTAKVGLCAQSAWSRSPEDYKQPIREAVGNAVKNSPLIEEIVEEVRTRVSEAEVGQVVVGNNNINPVAPSAGALDPKEPIAHIKAAGMDLEKRAREGGVIPAPVPIILQALPALAPAGSAAVSGPLPAALPNAPEAVSPEERKVTEDYSAQADRDLNNFSACSEKLSVLFAMYDLCEIRKQKNVPKGPSIFELARQASTPDAKGKKPDLWDLFIDRYPIRFSWKWIQCKLFYWTTYKWTSIVPNSVEAILKQVLQQTRNKLTDEENGEKRTNLVKGSLDKGDKLFNCIIDAFDTYCHAKKREGTLDDYLRRAVVSHYGYTLKRIKTDKALQKALAKHEKSSLFSPNKPEKYSEDDLEKIAADFALTNLCRDFSKKIMARPPKVPFFKEWKKRGAVAQLLCAPFEWILNRITTFLMRWILPRVIKTTVEGALEATKPDNLPVTIKLLEFSTSLFHDFEEKLEAKKGSFDPTIPIRGTAKLPQVVSKFIKASILHSCKEEDLRKKFAEFENGRGVIDDNIQESIQEAATEGAHEFVDFITNKQNHEKLFATFFGFLNKIFSDSEPKTDKDLQTAINNLEQQADIVFDTLVDKAAKERLKGTDFEAMKEKANQSFYGQKEVAGKMTKTVKLLLDQIKEKVDANKPADENVVDKEVAANKPIAEIRQELLTINNQLQSFVRQEEALNDVHGLTPAAREAINHALAPLYTYAKQLMEKIQTLWRLQEKFASHDELIEEFKHLQLQLGVIAHQADQTPLDLSGTLPTLRASLNKIDKYLSKNNSKATKEDQERENFILELHKTIDKIEDCIHLIVSVQNVLSELDKLDRWTQDLMKAKQGQPPAEFDLPSWLKNITLATAVLDEKEKEPLFALIEMITSFNSNSSEINLETLGQKLKNQIQDFYLKYRALKDGHKTQLRDYLAAFLQNNTVIIADYKTRKKQNYAAIVREEEASRALIVEIEGKADREVDERVKAIQVSPNQLGIAAAVINGLIGWVSPATAAFLGAASYLGVKNSGGLLSEKNRVESGAKTIGSAAIAGTAVRMAGATNPLLNIAIGAIPGFAAGSNFVDGAIRGIKDGVTPEVKKHFKALYKLAFSPFFLHALATWGMKAWVDSKEETPVDSIFDTPLTAPPITA